MTKSALPPQEHKKGTMYTEDDMQHVVAREVMKHRMDDYERGMLALTNQVKDSNAAVKAGLDGLDKSLGKHYDHVTECRDDLRLEIERDFVTKVEFLQELSKIEKVIWKATGVMVGALGAITYLSKAGII